MGVGVARWLPGVGAARTYQRAWVRADLFAGLALTALLIPAGMGYAQAAGLPPVTGLYATIVPLLAYAVVGPSRVLVLGPDSALAPIIAASIVVLAAGSTDRAVALAGVLAILMGAFLLAGGLLRLGFVTDLLSKPIRLGYLNGIALTVIVSQVPKALGFSTTADTLVGRLREIAAAIAAGEVDPTTAIISIASLAVIVVLRLAGSRVPGVLVAVVGAVLATWLLGLDSTTAVVGALPAGLPAPALSGLTWGDALAMVGPAAGIALIAFADTGVLSRTLAARRGETVDGSQEMAAIGIANVAAGLLGGFPVSASASRTPVAEQAGARTQAVGVVGAVAVLGFLAFARGVTAYLPTATLAAVVIVAAASLVDIPGIARLWGMSKPETALSASAFLGVALVGVLEGIVIALGLSLLAFVNRAWRPYRTELVHVKGIKGHHDIERHPAGRRYPGLVIARFDAPLFFANGGIFDAFVRQLVDDAPGPVPVGRVIIAAEAITGLDTTAIDDLVALDEHLAGRGIDLVFAEMKGPIKDRVVRYGLHARFGPEHFYPTLGAAVDAYEAEIKREGEADSGRAGSPTGDPPP